MNDLIRNHRTLISVGALLFTGVLGFALARFTGPSAGAQPETAAPAGAEAGTTLNVPASSLATMGIEVEPASAGNLGAEVNATGTVSAALNGQAVVTAHAAGTVSRISKRLGDAVAAGETLAQVVSRDAATMAAERRAAESKAALARSTLKRERELYEQRVTPRQDLETAEAQVEAAEAEAARARIAAEAAHVSGDGQSLAVVSPIEGRITSANVALGAYVEPDTELFRVADPRFVVIEASIPAADAGRIHAGDAAQITTISGTTLAATVTSLTPTINARTGSAIATLTLAEGQSAPAPGEFVRTRIMPKASSNTGVVVPDEAVQSVDARDVVFVRTDSGFKVQPVVIGARGGGRVAILSGVGAGDTIATKNAFLLKAEVSKGAEEEE